MENIFTLVLAALGLGFLIFIHELGHYWMARRAGMTVEAFSIGFGKPIKTWQHKGVTWKLCWLPFGGYVRIKGMESKGNEDPYKLSDGFYGKKPIERIKVALMGPIANLLFAFIAFSLIWIGGGREVSFSKTTHLVGWIDPDSPLYQKGLRPGDEIVSWNGEEYEGATSLIYASLLEGKTVNFKGFHIDYETQKKEPFSYTVEKSEDLEASFFADVLPATVLFLDHLWEGSPLEGSGLQKGDRIVWMDGELLFSSKQMSALVNKKSALLSIQRGEEKVLVRVPRILVADLKLSDAQRVELDDWRYAAGLQKKQKELFFIPYNVTSEGVVESSVTFLDDNFCEKNPESCACLSSLDAPLHAGDKILAVDGAPIASGAGLFCELQTKRVQLIVERKETPSLRWTQADKNFEQNTRPEAFRSLLAHVGSGKGQQEGSFYLLAPIAPKPFSAYPLSAEKVLLDQQLNAQKKAIEALDDPQKKQQALSSWEAYQQREVLGVQFVDQKVQYNPSPFALFFSAFDETWRTLTALVSGYLHPKWMTGPIGMVQVMQQGWSDGVKDALFWMGLISLNLGVLNLLPIPVLDGGHICFALYEKITKKQIKPKTMERLIIPFVILLVLFFVYVTYQDLARLISRFF